MTAAEYRQKHAGPLVAQEERMKQKEKRHKYGVAEKSERTVDGITFASKGEMKRWLELRQMERAGLIRNLARQKVFPLEVNGVLVCRYVGDFTYAERRAGDPIETQVVEDFKGVRTEAYKLKAKLFLALYGITIRETGSRRLRG